MAWLKKYWLVSLWLIIGLVTFCVYWINNIDVSWTAILGLATWVLAGGIFFTFIQIGDAKKSTDAQIAVDLFRELRRQKIKDILYFIYTSTNAKLLKLNRLDEKKVENLMDRFELLGTLVNEGIVNKRLAIEAYAGPPLLRVWYKLAPYLRQQETKRGFHVMNYEDFVHFTVKYFHEKHMEVHFYGKGNDDIWLVKFLRDQIKRKDPLRPRKYTEIIHELPKRENH